MFSTIRARLLWLVVLTLLPAFALLTYNGILLRQRVFEHIQENAARVTALTGQRIETQIEETRSYFHLLERMPEIQAMDDSASRLLREVMKQNPDYTNLAIADLSGKIVSSAIPLKGEVRVSERYFFKETVATGAFSVGKYEVNPISGHPGLNLGYPLLDAQDRLRGVLFASLGFAWASNFAERADLPQEATLLVIDVAGTVRRLGLPFESLRTLLIRFAQGQRKTLEALREAVEAGEPSRAAREAHALAGAAGNLGADQLREASKVMEKAGRDEQTNLLELFSLVEQRAAVVFRSIEALQASSETLPTHAGAVPVLPADPVKLRTSLAKLHHALGELDLSSSAEAIAELQKTSLDRDMGKGLARLRELVENYEYDEAAALTCRLLENLKEETPS